MSPSKPVRIASQDEIGTPLGRLRAAGFVDDGPATLPEPRRVMDSYALVFVHQGTGSYVDDTTSARPVQPGDTIVVAPGQPHWYGPPPSATWSEIFLVFDGPIFDVLATSGVLDTRQPVRRVQPFQPWCERLRAFADRRRGSSLLECQLDVLELATLLVELHGHDHADPVPRPIRRARELLAGDLTAELDLRAVAADVGLPYETFRKRFRAATGASPAAFRLDRRIEAAQSLLRMTTETHAAIATSLGFADEYHFAKRFRTRVGMSPREYRRAAMYREPIPGALRGLPESGQGHR
ncbi:AraC family transcriptional regulator [Actinophytocola sp.]|uniref:AraC family transcriptional regulator n=1 Tax=Actinophytocola sp. TaxID=1872138 RepID=UPI002ED2AA81